MNNFLARLTGGHLIFDGSMGALIEARGIKTRCPAALNAENSEAIRSIHADYAAAGADVSITNTFGANPIKLRALGMEERLNELIEKGVENARAAGNFVALDIGPTGEFLRPVGTKSVEEMVDGFRACAQAGKNADAVIVETMADVAECRAALVAAKETGLPVVASMTFEKNCRTLTGNTPECCALILEHAGASAIGINCSGGPDEMIEPLRRMRAVTNLPIVVQPNAGLPVMCECGCVTYPFSPEDMAVSMQKLADAGATSIGGCCGTTPAHISAMKSVVFPAFEKKELPGYICSQRQFVRIDEINAARVDDVDDLLDLDDDINAVEFVLDGLSEDEAIEAIEEAQTLCQLPFLFEEGTSERVLLHYTGVPGSFPMRA